MDPFFEHFDVGSDRTILWRDRSSGLRAVLAIDSLKLGPAVGGIRTQKYPSFRHAVDDAQKLAAAMTLKCAIAGLDAGGAKTVVLDYPELNRKAGFRRLGQFIDELRGVYWAAGDLGTTLDDLDSAAEVTRFVNRNVSVLADATARTVVNGIRACIEERGGSGLAGIRVAIQGCGAIGSGVARALAAAGSRLVISDIVPQRASRVAAQTGGRVQPPDEILGADVDIIAPCGKGGTISRATLERIKAWGICGGANNQLAEDDETGHALMEAGILYVPDFLASSGAVIAGAAPEPDGSRSRTPFGQHVRNRATCPDGGTAITISLKPCSKKISSSPYRR
ncbi:Glu/Leu/Phe/Val dehydrogenase [Sphingomonas panacisoli]|uniref:Glu/Leu/Phe/Val dehydrogenase n=1 Tax=Sphingomonas panacisoli TaxID=1813879 RepID=A0A5B8LFA5_9SPHN|nr:Glu/Leu/Phe/Val dehydrogenase dimerization domain-containing protein [Sphingomonas panacisoli]QDZ06404.1 Glu/Leu/Phe/Val dehydrogenase [Sphingomonas panacisoli]